jgi:hypothetical protein
MKRSAILGSLIGLVGLGSCTYLHGLGPGHCANGECTVAVKVGADCAIDADPNDLHVPAGGEAHVHWKIDPPSAPFVFDANGISFKPGQNPGQFDQKEPRANGKQFHWRDKNTLAGRYQYDINIRDASGRLCHLDPFIYNR